MKKAQNHFSVIKVTQTAAASQTGRPAATSSSGFTLKVFSSSSQPTDDVVELFFCAPLLRRPPHPKLPPARPNKSSDDSPYFYDLDF